MNDLKNTILLVEDQEVNRKIINRLLSSTYTVMEAANGREALEILEHDKRIEVVLLDLVMPVMGGFEVLEQMKEIGKSAIPVIVMTSSDDEQTEEQALQAGAIDFVRKPINKQILMSRIENALVRNQMVLLKRMEFIATHDSLTGLYNRNKMFDETRRMLDQNPGIQFAFVRFDLDKFRMYNTAMGEEEGNKLLMFIGNAVRRMAEEFEACTYGRIDADVFCMCEPYDEERLKLHVKIAQEELTKYRPDYSLATSFGIYVIDDPTLSVERIFTRASMAADKCKNLYEVHYAYYDSGMSEQITEEQEITNEMRVALEQEQFEVYLQPKYDLNTDLPCGAEALVRWRHPEKGLISPGKFIPVFEKNGFIATLDYYMWEHVCMLIHKWIEEGRSVFPISVNMSRISLFNRHVDELIIGLTTKYQVPTEILNLEVTESAYMANPEMMGEIIERLHAAGFIILMDDFGSGYSSLNTLKQIDIDVLKLDMKFMPNGEDNGKSERILSSIVRMAGWLGMDVIAEGVETAEQKQFLESIGCGYVQGYYYAKPMPVHDYEALTAAHAPLVHKKKNEDENRALSDALWSSNPHVTEILSSIEEPVVIFECSTSNTEIVRTNQAFLDTYGPDTQRNLHGNLSKEDELMVSRMLKSAAESGKAESCEFSYISKDGVCHWQRMKARRVASIPKSVLICALLEEITNEKLFETRLSRLVGSFEDLSQKKKLLVVDDMEVSRAVLRSMFEDRYEILEAENGHVAMELLKEHASQIAAVMLDMVMPQMDGEQFLKSKNSLDGAGDIPVVVISGESDAAVQLGMLKNGVSDYILKPFDLEITRQRVENAMAYQSRFKQLVREYRVVAGDAAGGRGEK